MHRILTAKTLHHNNFHSINLFVNNSGRNLDPQVKCSFCQKILLGRPNIESLFLSRHLSTRMANAVKTQKKKVKHKSYKKFGELLEVSEKSMTETKVSISKLKADHLSKLADSPVSLGQLHQLTTKPKKLMLKEVDPELLQSVKEKILKKSVATATKEISLEDDKCALIYTNHSLNGLEDKFKAKTVDAIKDSYYNFRKATIYDQRLQDLRFAISEGLNHEFDVHQAPKLDPKFEGSRETGLPKNPHAVFRELFIDNRLDSYDQELMAHISSFQTQGIPHPLIDDIYDDPILHNEIADTREDLEDDFAEESTKIKTMNIIKAKKALREKKKIKRDKRRAKQELSMKQDMRQLEQQGKQEALDKLLEAHMQLLCALNMTTQARQVLQYYRHRASKGPDRPKVNDVKVYNILLHGYASMGDISNCKELVSFMREDGVSPTPQTYAAILECIERAQTDNRMELLQDYYREMQAEGISLNDLLDKSHFLYDQRETLLKAVRRLSPAFEPEYTAPQLDYDCPLLDKITLDKPENRQGLLSSPAEGLMSLEQIIEQGKKQMQIEIRGEIEVDNIGVKDEETANVKFYRQKLKDIQTEWRSVIKEAFVRNLGTLHSQSNVSHSAITLYPYLKALEVDDFVELIMGEISKLVDGSETYSPTLKLLQRELGSQVYNKYQIEQFRRNGVLSKLEEVYDAYCAWFVSRTLGGVRAPLNGRQAWQTIAHQHRTGASLDMDETAWPLEIRQNIGKFLYNIIINDVKIDVNMFKPKAKEKKLAVVYRVYRGVGRVVRLEVKPHPSVCRLWASAAPARLRVRAHQLPARAPPRPWQRARAGAYLVTHAPLIRMPFYVVNQVKRLEAAPPSALYPVLDSLNQLGEVPWVVNKPILDLQLQIFRSGGNKKLEIAPPASSVPNCVAGAGEDAAARYKRRLATNRARAETHSLWCDALYKLSLANHYRDDIFWLPHNIDFRGRVYAVPPHLSQLGADTARALLVFANKRPLGKNGLEWLKLHAINLTGTMKKNTIQERLAHAESIMPEILDSADRPLDGRGWWMQSEEPWQTLACCMEIAKAVRSPNHEEYLCGFPVHQDGSCNGLQHYAALGADAGGARAVNLAPHSRPQDVYSAVAALVEEMRARDAKAGVAAAIVLEGFVRRKVIKQTVMTTVYGVTRFGARLQIAKQLKDIDEFPKDQVWQCSQYLTTRTFDSLREMFTSTKLIQDWFTDCAKVISGVCGESVEWVTPLGLPVVQPYYRRAASAHHQCRPAIDHVQRPCTMKQRNAFPPNFIHSLDSSHMMLTSLHCQAQGLTFVSVHDCFWTHPHTTAIMNKICREQFVALHSQPILTDLSESLVKRYSYDENEMEERSSNAANKKRVNKLLQTVPGKGDFDINSVLDSVYFFS